MRRYLSVGNTGVVIKIQGFNSLLNLDNLHNSDNLRRRELNKIEAIFLID